MSTGLYTKNFEKSNKAGHQKARLWKPDRSQQYTAKSPVFFLPYSSKDEPPQTYRPCARYCTVEDHGIREGFLPLVSCPSWQDKLEQYLDTSSVWLTKGHAMVGSSCSTTKIFFAYHIFSPCLPKTPLGTLPLGRLVPDVRFRYLLILMVCFHLVSRNRVGSVFWCCFSRSFAGWSQTHTLGS